MDPLLTRETVYRLIDRERTYQNDICASREYNTAPSVEAELLLMEHYIQEARSNWATNKGNEKALDSMRKVAGIAVRCFENHGCPYRVVTHTQ